MATGVDLIISALCNATVCTVVNNIPDPTWSFQDALPMSPSSMEMTRRIENHDSINMLAKEINGKHLKVATYINKPMSSAKPDPHNKEKLVGGGVAFFIMDILREKFNFTYDIVLAKKNNILGGSEPEDSLIGLVTTGKVDMAAAFVANILEFQQLVSFSVPIEEETWVMILKRPRESAVGEGLLAPFTNIVWFLILASVVTFGPCIYILTHIRAKLMPDCEPPVPLFRSVWFVYGTLIKQGTNLRPKANTTRVLFTTWWLFVMLLSAFYMANLTAFLTLSQFTLEINGPSDLMRKNYPWLTAEGGVVEFAVTKPTGNMYYLNGMVKKKRGQFQTYTSIDSFLRKVDKGQVLIKSGTTAILGLYQNYVKKTKQGVPEKDRCSYVVAPTPFTKNMRGFIYPKNSTLKTLFDSVIGVIIQSGIVEELKKLKVPNVKVCPMNLQTKERKLQVTDLVMTYQITVGGLCAAIAVFIGEAMAAGVDLIVSAICNATFCEPVYDNPAIETSQSISRAALNALAKEVNGAHLKIATYNNYPMSWVERQENGTYVGRGVAFTLVDILRKKFNFTYEVLIPEKNFELGGKAPEESLVGMVNASKVDMAAAFVPKVWQYRKQVEFSTDLDEGVWMMMLKRPKESAAGSGLLAPFNNNVWYLILVAVLAYGPCITLLTRLRAKLMPEDEAPIRLSPGFWFVYGAFIKQGTNLAPDANTTRVLFTTWWLFIILLSAFYTANLTAFLTLSKFTLDIEYPRDLYKKNYRWVAAEGSAIQYTVAASNEDLYYLNAMVKNGRGEYRSFHNDSEYLPMVRSGAVLVKERDAIEHTMYADYLQKAREGVAEADRCTYVVAPNKFMARLRGFIYPRNSKLKILFDSILWFITQAGLVNFLKTRDLPSTKICPLDLQSKDRQLRNSDLMMTYMIMIVGLCAATAIFIGEVVVKRYVRIKFRKPTDKSKQKRKKTKFNKNSTVHFYDDSGPPPYDAIFGKSKSKLLDGSQLKVVNGREYLVVKSNGGSRLVPVRTPSAFLYNLDK